MTNFSDYVTIPKAAEIIGVTESLVRRWVRADKIPAKKIGKAMRVIELKALKNFDKTRQKKHKT